MTVGAISNGGPIDWTQTTPAARQSAAQPAGGHQSALAALFGESNQQVWSDVRSGNTSLSAMAAAKGISQSDLTDALKQRLQQMPTNGGAALTDAQLTDMATAMANHVYSDQHPALAQLFGESSQQLVNDLQSGNTSLSALAQSRGISQSSLTDAIKRGVQHGMAGAASVPDWYFTDVANEIANRVHSASANAAETGPGSAIQNAPAATPAMQTDAERATFELHTMLPSLSQTS